MIVAKYRKSELVSLLQTKNVVTISPTFVDATYLYVVPSITVKYNIADTTLVAGQISNKVASTALYSDKTKNDDKPSKHPTSK